MRNFTFFLFFVAFLGIVFATEKFTTKYDNIDLDEILKSERLLNNYFKCVMDRGPCTPDGAELKKNIPDGLKLDCEPCSEKQKEGVKKVISYLAKNKRDMFNEVSAKFDPTGIYKSKHADEFAKEGIQL